MAVVRKVLVVVGGAASIAMIVLGVGGAAAADSPDPSYDPLPPISNGLPTFYTPSNTYVINGDGTRTNCMAIDQALSCDWK